MYYLQFFRDCWKLCCYFRSYGEVPFLYGSGPEQKLLRLRLRKTGFMWWNQMFIRNPKFSALNSINSFIHEHFLKLINGFLEPQKMQDVFFKLGEADNSCNLIRAQQKIN
jgi:hypothetical protein